jgi:hypothetical protein
LGYGWGTALVPNWAVRDFGDVRRGDLGGYIESEANLCHAGNAWVHDVAQVYGAHAVVRGNAQVRGEAWIMGCVEDDAQVDDLVIVVEGARVSGKEILLHDEIARSRLPKPSTTITGSQFRVGGRGWEPRPFGTVFCP